jgi:Protein of unknown function (DUF5818)
MKKQLKPIWSLGALAMILSVGVSLSAQQTTPPSTSSDPAAATPQTQTSDPAAAPQTQPTQPNDPTAQQPATTPQAEPSQTTPPAQSTPDAQSAASTTEGQNFNGTIVKSGDKYVLQDADTGKTYEVDHQDQVKQFEGKKVRVHGTLDASGKMIHVQ